MGELQADAYRIEYAWKDIEIVRPANVYGPYDNFDPKNAMVIPSLIRRAMSGEDPLVVWGDGSAIRDFIFARDVARGMLLVMEKAPGLPINLGSGTGVDIKTIVEIIVKKGARVRYTTIQNWSTNVYNLVTKRMRIEEEGVGEWVDVNLGSKLTMKYPSRYLVGRKAHGEILSIAYAHSGQHQDAGGKVFHAAPETTSRIVSKSISGGGGRTSYRGLLYVAPTAAFCKSKVVCDALILDPDSRSDTYPTMRVSGENAHVEHEATVTKIGEEQLFYLMSRGITKELAESLMVNGFIEPIAKELPMEYAVELNRLIELQMEGSVG